MVQSDIFDGPLNAFVESIPRGPKKVQAATRKFLGLIDRSRLSKGVNVEGLDDWFLLLAKYAVDPKWMEHGTWNNGNK